MIAMIMKRHAFKKNPKGKHSYDDEEDNDDDIELDFTNPTKENGWNMPGNARGGCDSGKCSHNHGAVTKQPPSSSQTQALPQHQVLPQNQQIVHKHNTQQKGGCCGGHGHTHSHHQHAHIPGQNNNHPQHSHKGNLKASLPSKSLEHSQLSTQLHSHSHSIDNIPQGGDLI